MSKDSTTKQKNGFGNFTVNESKAVEEIRRNEQHPKIAAWKNIVFYLTKAFQLIVTKCIRP